MMDRKTAEHINNLMNNYGATIDDSIMLVRDSCSPAEVENYLVPISNIMALMSDVQDLVYREYPDLRDKVD